MKIIPLSEYVLENGQAKTAEALGVHLAAREEEIRAIVALFSRKQSQKK